MVSSQEKILVRKIPGHFTDGQRQIAAEVKSVLKGQQNKELTLKLLNVLVSHMILMLEMVMVTMMMMKMQL